MMSNNNLTAEQVLQQLQQQAAAAQQEHKKTVEELVEYSRESQGSHAVDSAAQTLLIVWVLNGAGARRRSRQVQPSRSAAHGPDERPALVGTIQVDDAASTGGAARANGEQIRTARAHADRHEPAWRATHKARRSSLRILNGSTNFGDRVKQRAVV